ncbi:hypothetical protein CK203_040405 [Vitis vinifera]|uniref:Uncharacterized protein n=1 Tax=Vitis vinifera TaxID=29760 RepID=A0A438FX68_VITVI|nr:hypothetical protein CK203_040405 [Vitis vinifera]
MSTSRSIDMFDLGSASWIRVRVASLSAKFRMPEIEQYMGIGCPRIHLRLYSIMMRAHGLDEAQMIMLSPMSLKARRRRIVDCISIETTTSIQDDVIHMLSWDDGLPKMIVPNDGYEIVEVILDFLIPAPFSLILDRASLQLIPSTPSDVGHGDTFAPFILWPEDVDVDVQVMTCSGRIT